MSTCVASQSTRASRGKTLPRVFSGKSEAMRALSRRCRRRASGEEAPAIFRPCSDGPVVRSLDTADVHANL
ncbi:hypothetical protein BRADI_4g09832v3 [Brachypodium distachyon]|uniref:Uncharacterized protein n=1 Tax=Brachypodium distachyon TaxID=15368 RepID=A0A0Q3EHK4_BRADI|nr:hypothetical protein BRADI_4g09832v3 [Brachypodium distachyon]